MNHAQIYARILQAVDEAAYLTPVDQADPTQRPALDAIRAAFRQPDFDAATTRALVTRLHEAGSLDRVHMLSALHVIAASPKVRDWAEAARLAGEQELAALELGGPYLQPNLASVDRHRGVIAFLRGFYEVALDHFTRALERQRTPENLGNVLATLLRLGELDEASSILAQVRRTLPAAALSDLDARIAADPDLALLRPLETP